MASETVADAPPAAPELSIVAAEPVTNAPAKAEDTPKKRRARANRPTIDLDSHIKAAQNAAKEAAKMLTKARAEARTERKRRARLIRKAGQLSPADLERIAVLKRTGWWDPSTGSAVAVPAKEGEGADTLGKGPAPDTPSGASASGSANASPLMAPAKATNQPGNQATTDITIPMDEVKTADVAQADQDKDKKGRDSEPDEDEEMFEKSQDSS